MQEKTYAVIGDPIAHSLSPLIHNTLYRRYQLNCTYIPIKISIAQLPDFFNTSAKKLAGFNVTMPLKQAVLSYLDEAESHAKRAKSINTVQMGAKISGTSTDGPGLQAAIQAAGHSLQGRTLLLYGAGAVSPPILLAFAPLLKKLYVVNRTRSRAQSLCQLATELGLPAQGLAHEEMGEVLSDCNLFINATPLGMAGTEQDFPDLSFIKRLSKDALVVDLLYNPPKTRLLQAAKDAGLATLGGLPMLIHQAFLSFSFWFGITPTQEDYEAVLAAMPKAFQF